MLSKGNSMRRIFPFAVILLCVIAFGCGRKESSETPVARFDDEVLTLEKVISKFDTAQGVSQAQMHDYVQRWLLNELLYRESVRRGLDKKEEIEERITDIRRQLAINALLDEVIYSKTSLESSEDEIRMYYTKNKDLFVLTEDVAQMSLALFESREAANAFRTVVVKGKSWDEAKKDAMTDPVHLEDFIHHTDSLYYTEKTLLPAELWRMGMGINRKEASYPVKTDEGFYVLIVWRVDRKGGVADLPYVRDEINNRLAIQRRKELYDDFVDNLRAKHKIQILLESVNGSSTSNEKKGK